MSGIWNSILYLVVGLLVGGGLGFFITKRIYDKQLRENPPINENMIKMLYSQVGRKPSEAQVRAIMKSMGLQQNDKEKKDKKDDKEKKK